MRVVSHESGPKLLTGVTLDELAPLVGGRPRALAVLQALYRNAPPLGVPEVIAGVAAAPWREARAHLAMPAWRIAARHVASDGTIKYAIELDGATVETVLIPGRGRSTVCVSSQAGCTRKCAFCATAKLGFTRNLRAGEIVLQWLIAAQDALPQAPARNVVFMGMGEPMDNLDEVLAALAVLTGTPAPRLAAQHLTVSTSGILPGMVRFLAASRAHLALSLNGTTDAQRDAIMPHNKRWPIAELLEALRADAVSSPGRRYFMEYVMLAGVNDADDDAARLVALLADLPAHVNLIPHNPFPSSPLRSPPLDHVIRFRDLVHRAGVRCLVRMPRGQDVAAACGQLALRAPAA